MGAFNEAKAPRVTHRSLETGKRSTDRVGVANGNIDGNVEAERIVLVLDRIGRVRDRETADGDVGWADELRGGESRVKYEGRV